MEHFADPELCRLYRVLDRELDNVRLALAENIRIQPLYKENRARTDDQDEIFDPIGQAPINPAMGFWCFTPLYYDERGQPIRRVPVGSGSWKARRVFPTPISQGEKWCKRRFTFNRFTMIEYSLGGEETQPKYAICHILPNNEGAARNPPPNRGQRDLPQNQAALPGNSTRPGDIAEESTYIPPGHLNAPTETATVVAAAPQGPPLHDDLNNKRKLVIHDTSDGSEWTIEGEVEIEFFKMLKSAQGQSARGIRQPSPHEGADLDIGIEDIWNLCGPLYGMANPWNAQVTDPSYNIQGFSNDDVWTADPNIIYGEASDNLSQENFRREGGATDESNYIPPGHPDASTNMTAVVAPAPQGLPSHDNSNNRRKVQGTENLESSTAYNLGCSDDDIHNSGPQV